MAYPTPRLGRSSRAASRGRNVQRKAATYVPTERQAKAHSCLADVVLYGGAAGGGKSEFLLWEAFMESIETPGNYAVLMRRTFPELEKSLIMRSLAIYPPSLARYNEPKRRWTIRTKGADSILDFAFCRDEKDVFQYQSSELGFLGIDELTHWTQFQFAYLLGRVRSSRPGSWPRVRCASNPGSVGHRWVKNYFGIGKMKPETVFTPEPSVNDPMPIPRCYIPARLSDNPYLNNADPQYQKRLMLLPPSIRKMLVDGDWDVFEGQYFKELSEAHFVKPFAIPAFWKVYRSVDYGFTKPFCCLWFAAAPDGHYYAFRELYTTGMRDEEQARAIAKLSGEHVEYSICDPSMNARNSTGKTAAEAYLQAADIALVPGDNHRVPGWMALRNMLAPHKDGTPVLRVFDTCTNFKRELEDAVVSMQQPEDLDSDGEDHALDAARYFAMSRPMVPLEKEAERYPDCDERSRQEWLSLDKRIAKDNALRNRSLLSDLNVE